MAWLTNKIVLNLEKREKRKKESEEGVEVERMKPSEETKKNRLLEAFSCKTKKVRRRVGKEEEAERTKKPINDRNLVIEDVTPLNTRYATTKCKP